MKNILDWIEENKQQFEGPEPRITVAQLDNVNTPDLEQSEFLEPKRIDIFGNVIPAETLEDWDVTFRRPNADGGRIGFKKDGFVGPKTLEYKKGRGIDKASVRDLNPFFKGTIKGSKIYEIATKQGLGIDEIFDVVNAVTMNKGNIASYEHLAREASIFAGEGKTKRPDGRKIKNILNTVGEYFPELKNLKFIPERYKGVGAKQVRFLNTVADAIIAGSNSQGDEVLAHFLPENLGMYYKRSADMPDVTHEFFRMGKEYNLDKAQVKYITDRVTKETGTTFTPKNYKIFMGQVKNYRKMISSDIGQAKRAIDMNKNIKKLYDDETIQNLLKSEFNADNKKKLLARAVEITGDDVAIASRRLFQMAQSMSGTRNIDGIKLNKSLANKIIDTQRMIGKRGNNYALSSLVYDHYGKVIDNTLKAKKGESFIGYYQQNIRNLLDNGRIPDEIFSVTASARRGLSPYAIFTQALEADVNSKIKGAKIDSALSRTHESLQKIFKGRKWSQLNINERKAAQALVNTFEATKADAIKDLSKAQKASLQLASFDLKNPPSKAIEGFDTRFGPKLKKAFNESFNNVGYSMNVPKNFLTQKEMLNQLKGVKVPSGKGRAVVYALSGILGYNLVNPDYVDAAETGQLTEKTKWPLTTGETVVGGAAGSLAFKTSRNFLWKALAGIDLPPVQVGASIATGDPTWMLYGAPFTKMAVEQTGLGAWAPKGAFGKAIKPFITGGKYLAPYTKYGSMVGIPWMIKDAYVGGAKALSSKDPIADFSMPHLYAAGYDEQNIENFKNLESQQMSNMIDQYLYNYYTKGEGEENWPAAPESKYQIYGSALDKRADGGRAGYMGGGITAIRKPHAIPPERQGLRSIMINGKKS